MLRTVSNRSPFRQNVISVLLGGMAVFAVSLMVTGAGYAQYSVRETEAQMMTVATELFGYLKTNFPNEFGALVTQVEAADVGGGNLDGLVQAHLLILRQKFGAHLVGASDASLSALPTPSIALQNAVLEGKAAATCGSFAAHGAAALQSISVAARYEDLIMAQTVLLLAAAKGGHDATMAGDPAVEQFRGAFYAR